MSFEEERCGECQLWLRPPDQSDIEYTREVVRRMDPQKYRYRFCVCPACGGAHLEFAKEYFFPIKKHGGVLMSANLSDNVKKLREYKGNSLIVFPDTFCVIDTETTGYCAAFDSVIEVAAVIISNGAIIDTFSSLVKPDDFSDGVPYLSSFVEELTGITDEMLSSAPSTLSVMTDLRNFINDTIILVGHNVNFDINFLYDSFVQHGLPALSNDYIDTMRLAKRLHPEFPHHRLIDLAQYYSVAYEGAHRSLADVSITTGCYYALKADIEQHYSSLSEFTARKRHYHTLRARDIASANMEFDPDNPFFQKTCVFTGVLQKMVRRDAMQIIVDLGGINADSVTKKTNFLILGNNDYCSSIKDGKSSKQKKAEKYKLEGQDIEIIPENVFYDMISDMHACE